MEEIPAFTGLKDEKTIDFLKLSEVKPDIQFKKLLLPLKKS